MFRIYKITLRQKIILSNDQNSYFYMLNMWNTCQNNFTSIPSMHSCSVHTFTGKPLQDYSYGLLLPAPYFLLHVPHREVKRHDWTKIPPQPQHFLFLMYCTSTPYSPSFLPPPPFVNLLEKAIENLERAFVRVLNRIAI